RAKMGPSNEPLPLRDPRGGPNPSAPYAAHPTNVLPVIANDLPSGGERGLPVGLNFVEVHLRIVKVAVEWCAGANPGVVEAMTDDSGRQHPLLTLSDTDLEFVLRLVLASGSLKEVAQAYGVSYPTIRARLDRVIAQLDGVLAGRPSDPMAERLADLVERGEIMPAAARKLLELHRREVQRLKGK